MATIQKNQITKLAWLCTATYVISYLTRINFGAVVSNIAENTGISNTDLALAPTVLFITYGVGQLISGYLGDKVQPKFLVGAGLFATALMNFFLPFCSNANAMAVLWGINGMAQAFMWPPIVKLMLSTMTGEEYKKHTFKVLFGSMFATMSVYLISPLLVSLFTWKGVFYFASICGAFGLVVWVLRCPIIDLTSKATTNENGENKKSANAPFPLVLIVIFFAIICMGALRDGVTTWLPSYIVKEYNLGSQTAIFTGAVIPLFTMACYLITSKLYKTKLKNPMLCAGVIFAVGLVSAGILSLLTDIGANNVVVSVLLSSLLAGSMHGVNLILISMLPSYFRKNGNTSLISGLLNCFVYVGSALSTYLFPLFASNGDWRTTIFIWFVIAVVGTAICLLTISPWKKFEKKLND